MPGVVVKLVDAPFRHDVNLTRTNDLIVFVASII